MSIEIDIKLNDGYKRGLFDGTEKGTIVVCDKIVASAKSIAPVDEGELRNAIHYKVKTRGGVISKGFNDNSSQEQALEQITEPKLAGEGKVGLRLDHGIYQEFGTRHHDPQPFLRPAVNSVIKGSNIRKEIAIAFDTSFREALRKGQIRKV